MMKVLIIDDSPDALSLAKARLDREGLTLICADGGQSGFALALHEKPDLILLDLEMPDLSGFEVCRQLKANIELCMIPVIFLSGSSETEDKVKGLNLGAVDYVSKPFDPFELPARVNAALRTKHLQDLLVEHANIDPLTGLANRRWLMERMAQEWASLQRHGGIFSVIMCDIDHFKQVNDTFGHVLGDRILQAVANTLADQCRVTDLPARYGGEEFVLVLPQESITGAGVFAERCRRAIAAHCIRVEENQVQVTASFGVAQAAPSDSPESIIARADQALYNAKQSGRNCVQTA